MKKILAMLLVAAMLFVAALPVMAAAEEHDSPVATTATNQNGNDSPNAPQTGNTDLLVMLAGGTVVCLCAAVVAGKKVKDSAEQ